MNAILASIPVTGIIRPGQAYILNSCDDHGMDHGPIDTMYIIARDEDIISALELEWCLVLPEMFQLTAFVRCAEVAEDVYEFRFRCIHVAYNMEIGYSLYLHRIMTFQEQVKWAREVFTTT